MKLVSGCYYCNGHCCDHCGSRHTELHTRREIEVLVKTHPQLSTILQDMIDKEVGFAIYCRDCPVTYAIAHCKHKRSR
jgi:hypothetical protein